MYTICKLYILYMLYEHHVYVMFYYIYNVSKCSHLLHWGDGYMSVVLFFSKEILVFIDKCKTDVNKTCFLKNWSLVKIPCISFWCTT